MSVCVDGSRTNTRKTSKAGRKKRIWPRRVIAMATKSQLPSSKFQRNPKQQTSIGAARLAFGVWALGFAWDLGFGIWIFSQSLSCEVLLVVRPELRCVWQLQSAGQKLAAHFVKHGGLLRPVSGVGRWDNDRRGRQNFQHPLRQRIARELDGVASR